MAKRNIFVFLGMEEGLCELCARREEAVLLRLLQVQERMAEALKQSQILLRQADAAEQRPPPPSDREAELSML